jgi:hypothetical protein
MHDCMASKAGCLHRVRELAIGPHVASNQDQGVRDLPTNALGGSLQRALRVWPAGNERRSSGAPLAARVLQSPGLMPSQGCEQCSCTAW